MLGTAAGMMILLLTVRLVEPPPGTWVLAPGLLVAGLGMGMVAPTLVDVSLAGVDHHDAGSAAGMVTAAGQLGGALGVAFIGAVFFGAFPHQHTATDAGAIDYAGAFGAALSYEIGVLILARWSCCCSPRQRPHPRPPQRLKTAQGCHSEYLDIS